MLKIDATNILDSNPIFIILNAENIEGIRVEIYESQADAEAKENIKEVCYTSGYGTQLPVVSLAFSKFSDELDYLLLVSGEHLDEEIRFAFTGFVDLSPIFHTIYQNTDLAARRAQLEVAKHSAQRQRTLLVIPSSFVETQVGNIISHNSTLGEKDTRNEIIISKRLELTADSTTETLETIYYGS